MKKRNVIIVIVVLILIAIASVTIYKKAIENGKKYEIETVSQYNYFILKQNDLYGVIDRKGDIIIAPEYSEIIIPNPEKALFVCYKGDNTQILNENKEEVYLNI
jgi:competence protein ComGC